MDFAYSPHREGGTMHLPSPTHHHGYGLDHLTSIQQLRRSLSRSPSKPSRFHLRKSDSPGSPLSPLALARALSPKANSNNTKDNTLSYPESPLSAQVPPTSVKKRFTLRRSAPFRQSPRNRTTSKSPRRALTDSTDQGNATPFAMRRPSGEENEVRRTSAEQLDHPMTGQKPAAHRDIDDRPLKFRFSQSRQDLNAPTMPVKSSPLKRSDGIMNLDTAGRGSPVAKRRSLHGTSSLGVDFDIFAQTPAPRPAEEEQRLSFEGNVAPAFSFSSPIPQVETPLRKSLSLRKSTLSQRPGNAPRARPGYDGEFAIPGAAASKTRNRMSLDSSLAFSGTTQSPFRKSTNFETMRGSSHQSSHRGSSSGQHPHPLSNALTPTSSSMADVPHEPAPPTVAPPPNHPFARSLPLGISRPQYPSENSDSSFETPMVHKMAPPNPVAFMSTGLLSKKNRDVDELQDKSYVMPGTPSKRNSFPPVTASPSVSRRNNVLDLGKISRPEFGQPSTPFSSVHRPSSSASFGQGVNIFGSFNSGHQRRSSFASIEGDDISHSPCGNRMTDSQSSADDMPPTPTKQNDGAGRRSKDSSLRRKTFRQHGRPSLGASTYSAPDQDEPSIELPEPSTTRKIFGASSPHTPNDTFTPPDASKLSISAGQRRGSLPFNSSTNSALFPPATPTTPRDHTNFFANGPSGVIPITGLTENDVDPSISQRFKSISRCGHGEFSTVYRVENPVQSQLSFASSPPNPKRAWAVKVTKKPYTGSGDREHKLKEARILRDLKGHDHVVSYEDHWEYHSHLYIQTEFCEEGNLMSFLATAGHKSRLDDFRIWKILLELSSGVKHIHDNGYIHLDLKPANILITFDGILKIADFGLATTWPAARGIEGDGDRRYLAPEALQQGRYDKPGDIYSLGAMMLEIAGNIVLPHNGSSWQRLRQGDFSELPSLTWSSESSLNRDGNGEPLDDLDEYPYATSTETVSFPDNSVKYITVPAIPAITGGLMTPPRFMIDDTDPDSLHQITQCMMQPMPENRPTIDQVYACFGCRWTEGRSRAGATIYEGVWGPGDDVIQHLGDVVHEGDAMDMS